MDLVIDKANDNFIQRQFVSQGDYKGRTMTVQVTDNGLIGKVPGLTLNLRWRNQASGLADLSAFECIDVENSLFRIEYPVRMMTPGKVVANIQVIQNGQVTHLKTFEMTVQTLAGEMTGIVDKAEYGALVAVLADANKFRTDIDTLVKDKADKTALAQTDAEVAELDSIKADKAALASSNDRIDGIAANKVDKGGASQVTMGMLSQEVKTAMTGGSVAVVGKDAVGTTNVVDDAITLNKIDKNLLSLSYTSRNGILPNYTLDAEGNDSITLSIGEEDLIIYGKFYYWVPQNTVVMGSGLKSHSVAALFFNVTDQTFRLDGYNSKPLTGEVILGNIPRRNYVDGMEVNNSFACTINGVRQRKNYLPQADWEFSGDPDPYQIDYAAKKLIFNAGGQVSLGNTYVSFDRQEIDLTDVFEQSTSYHVLIFNLVSKELKTIPVSQANSEIYKNGEWVRLTDIRRKDQTKIVLQNPPQRNDWYNYPQIRFINAVGGKFVVENETNELTFYCDVHELLALGKGREVKILATKGTKFSMVEKNGSNSSALVAMYDSLNNTIEFLAYNTNPSFIDWDRYRVAFQVRRRLDANNKVTGFWCDIPIPWEFDGKLYGKYSAGEGSTYPLIPVDAKIACQLHRGYSYKYPENTLLAYRKAKEIGVSEIEMDLSWTSDLVPVSLHDPTLNRTARNMDGTPLAEEISLTDITYDEALQYEYGGFKSPEFFGEKLPTLEEIICQCKLLNQQIHMDRAFQLDQEKFDIVSEIVDKHKYEDMIAWAVEPWNPVVPTMIRTKYPHTELICLSFGDITENQIATAKSFNLPDAKCSISARADQITEEMINAALAEGLEIMVWSADNVDRMNLVKLGVTGFSTDRYNIQENLITKGW